MPKESCWTLFLASGNLHKTLLKVIKILKLNEDIHVVSEIGCISGAAHLWKQHVVKWEQLIPFF
jgi:hypothetical protein